MNLLYSIFFAAGVAGVAYTQLGKRLGFGNPRSVWIVTGVVFVLTSIVFYTILVFLVNP